MILIAILSVIVTVFKILLGIVPDIPQMPGAVTDPLNFLASFVGSGIGTVQYIMSPPIFIALVVVGVALLAFDLAWAVFWWTIRKVPGVNVIRQ